MQSPFCLDVGFVSTIVRALLMCAAVILTQTIGAASWMSPSVQSAVAAFSQWRSNNQLAVTSITAFFLYFSSDALSQCALSGDRAASTSSEDGSRRIQLDIARMARSGFTSALLSGFLACFYFAWLDRTFRVSPEWHAAASDGMRRLSEWGCVAGKVATDVGVYEPIYDCMYITLQALLRGEGLDAARSEVALKVLKVWAMAPRYWCLMDALNFSLVSLRLRPMTNALLSIPWSMYISSVANSAQEKPQAAPSRA